MAIKHFSAITAAILFSATGLFFMSHLPSSATATVNAETHTLKNGLKIVVLKNGVSPIATVGMIVNVGTADDPIDQVGLSHFMEHMMFKGTKTVPSDQFKRTILRAGGETNALTEYDYTLYYTTVALDKVDFILSLEADRLRNLSFSNDEVESEKKVVMEERNMRIENNPMGTVYERYLQARNPYHPYGTLPIGFPHHILAYSFDSVRAHYNKWYHPNNVTIVVSGLVTMKDVLPSIEKHFASIPSQPIPSRVRIQNPPRDGVTQTIIQYNVRNSLLILLWSFDAPHYLGCKDKKTYYALELLQQILGGNDTTDFTRKMVEEKKCAIQISSEYDGDSIDAKDFAFTAVLTPDMNVETIKKELRSYLEQIIKAGVSDDELNRSKNDRLSPFDTLKDGTDAYLFTVSSQLAKGKTIEDINAYIDGIKAVTNADIINAAKQVLGQEPAVYVEMHPGKTAD